MSEEAAKIIDPTYIVNPACNYYFMAASTLFISIAGTLVTEKIVIPRLGEYKGEVKKEEIRDLNKDEKRGLRFAAITGLIFIGIMLYGILPESGFLRDAETGSLLRSPFMSGIVALIFLGAAVLGVAYGIGARSIKNDSDVMKGMGKAMETLGIYIVLVFFAAQFVAYFGWSNIGLIVAIEGAELLKASGLGDIPLMIAFIIVAAIVNLFMGSASAKWAIMAPVFIPMFMLIGYSPEFTQVAYRIGDSISNIVSPMMSYFALIVAFVGRYIPSAGIGTIIATMLPYSIVFFIVWTILLIVWMLLGIPIGPEAYLYLK